MTTPDLTLADFAGQETLSSAPLFPETNRGVQPANGEDRANVEDDRSAAWRAVMSSHLL